MSTQIVSFDQINALLARPFNDPKSETNYSEKSFLEENQRMHAELKHRLALLGDFDEDETDDDDADFWMSKGGGITRCISVTLTSRKMWTENLIALTQSFLRSIPKDYLVYVDSSLNLEQPIFLLVTKDCVMGFAENLRWLAPFGFRP